MVHIAYRRPITIIKYREYLRAHTHTYTMRARLYACVYHRVTLIMHYYCSYISFFCIRIRAINRIISTAITIVVASFPSIHKYQMLPLNSTNRKCKLNNYSKSDVTVILQSFQSIFANIG